MHEETVFHLALKKPAGERSRFLDHACGGDADLRRRLDVLLGAHDRPDSFLAEPACDLGVTSDSPPGGCDGDDSGHPAAQEIGRRIGPFKLLQKLGEGGMGTVWVAEQSEPVKRRVALKVIKAGMDSAQVLRRFEAERQALAMMDHSSIAKVLEAGTTDEGRPYFVMELIKGVPITRYCDELHLPLAERLALFVPVCQAIQHAHQKGIIHRDIKPSNVLVAIQDGKPIPKVIDFGVAKALHQPLTEQSLYTEIGQIVGTLEYMSPEQAELSALDIDTRADVYALGVLLYELLTGSTPLDRKRLGKAAYTEMVRMIREDDPPRPSTRLTESKESLASLAAQRRTEPARLTRALRGELDWIAMKCLEKDRTRRYETASGLAQDVERYLADEPVEACPPRAGYKLRKFARKHRTALATVTAFAVVLVAGAAVSTMLAVRATTAEAVAKEEEGKALTERDAKNEALITAELRKTEAEDARRDSEGALVDLTATTGSTAGDRNEPAVATLWFANAALLARTDLDRERVNLTRVRNWGRMAPAPVAAVYHPGERVVKVAFHPSGRSLMVLTETRCTITGLPGGRPEALPGGDRPVTAADWSPDGTRLALGTPGGKVEIVRVSGGDRVEAFDHPGSVGVVRFSPNGRYLAVAGDRTRVWDCEANGFATPELPHPGRVLGLVFNGRGDRLVTTCADGNARVFTIPGGPEPLTAPLSNRLPGPPANLPTHPVFVDGDRGLLTIDYQGVVVWRDTTTWQEVRRITTTSGYSSVVPDADGRRFVVASYYSGQIWDVDPAKAVSGSTISHGNLVYAAAFSPDGQTLLTVGADRIAKFWSVPSGTALYAPVQHQNDLKFATFSPDGQMFATGQDDGLVRVWASPRGLVRSRQVRIDGELLSAQLSPDGRHTILSGNHFGNPLRTRVYEVATGEAAGPYLEADGPVIAAALSPDGRTAATAIATKAQLDRSEDVAPSGEGGRVRFWDWRTGRPRGDSVALPAHPRDLAYSPDGTLVVATCHGGQIVLIDPATGQVLARPDPGPPEKTDYRFPGVRFGPDGRSFITWGADGAVRVWEARTGALRYPPLRHGGQTLDATPSPVGGMLVTGARDNTARVWDLETGRPLTEPLPHPDYVFSACFSPDGERVLTACRDGSARIWDWRSGRLTCPPLRNGSEAWSATFTLDGREVITGAHGFFRVWDSRTGKSLTPSYHLRGSDRRMLITPDGRSAVMGGFAPAISVFDLGDLTGPGGLGPDDAVVLGELISGHRVFKGELAGLTTAEWLDRWRVWSTNHPGHEAISPLSPRDWHRVRAHLFEADKQLAGAAWHLERLTAIDPGNQDLWVRLGKVRRELGRNAEAAAALGEAVRLNPADASAFFQRGWAHEAMNAHDKAVADYTEAIRLNPGYWRPYTSRSLNRRLLGDVDGAVADATEAIRLLPTHTWPWMQRGDAYRAKGEYDAAIADYGEAIRLDPRYESAYFQRALAHSGARHWDRAAADYDTAIRLNPRSAAAYSNRSLAFIEMGNYERAIADATAAIGIDPSAVRAWRNRARAHRYRKEYTEAIADYTEVISLDPRSAWYYDERGYVYLLMEAYDKAVADCTEAIRIDPKLWWSHAIRGEAFTALAQYDNAVADLTEAIWLNPKNAGLFNDRAVAFAARYEYDKAIADCDAAIRLNPILSGTRLNRSRYRRLTGDTDGALDDLTVLLRANPLHAATIYERGNVWATRGDWDRASCDFAHAAILNPGSHWPLMNQCVLSLRAGSITDYQRACERLMDRFGETEVPLTANDTAWACAVSPDSGIAPWRLVELAGRGLAKDPKDSNALNTMGAALYRAGRYEEAVARLDDAIRVRDGTGMWADWLFLALAHHRLGHADDARRWLAKAVAWWDKDGKDAPKDEHGLPLDWTSRVQFRVLRAEAEGQLAGKEKPEATPKPPEKK